MTESSVGNTAFLDQGMAQLLTGEDVAGTMEMLFAELQRMRDALPPEVWKEFAAVDCRRHPIMQLLHQDPLSLRVFSKPRGYAGDAMMLDFIYAPEDGFTLPAVEESSELGKYIYHYMSHAEAAKAVRARRRIIIDKLNDLAADKPKPHVLSLACGHVREAKRCSAFLEGRIGRFVAMDYDKESLAVVERELGPLGVETVQTSVRDLLTGQVAFSGFDLVYASGLHDYLLEPAAQRLSEVLFGMLNPGGRFLVANFLPNISNAGYMETYLDWWLIYRTEAELRQLAATLPHEQVESISTFIEENKNIAFLEVERKG